MGGGETFEKAGFGSFEKLYKTKNFKTGKSALRGMTRERGKKVGGSSDFKKCR